MFWIILSLTVPVFYIVGLVTVIRWLLHQGGHSAGSSRSQISAELRDWAKDLPADEADTARRAATRIEKGITLPAPTDTNPPLPHLAPVAHSATRPPAVTADHWTSLDVGQAFRKLDNINLLLFLGAFLVVVSAGIFVGYNFSTLSGVFKVEFLGAFALIFYAAGLMLYLYAPKLRPAGTTFTGIGLVLLPLVGLAAYNFTSLGTHGPAVWLVTSIITLACYGFTLATTRQTYIAFLMAFTTLSLFESSVSVLNLPIYWFGWAMAIVSLLLLAVSRWEKWWQDATASIMISANIFLPVSLLFSLAHSGDNGLPQLAVTIALAGVFYAGMTRRYAHQPEAAYYCMLAIVSLPAALGVGLWDQLSPVSVAGLMLGVAGLYWVLGRYMHRTLPARWSHLLGIVTAVLPFMGAVLVAGEIRPVALCLAAGVLLNAELGVRLRRPGFVVIAMLTALTLPDIIGREIFSPQLPWGAMAAAYVAAGGLFVAWRWRFKALGQVFNAIAAAGYLLAFVLALCMAAASGAWALLLSGLAIAAAMYALSYLEKAVAYVTVAVITASFALLQLVALLHWSDVAGAAILGTTGLAVYAAGWLLSGDERRSRALRYTGLILPYAGATWAFSEGTSSLRPIASLAAGALLLWIEARRQANSHLQEVADGVAVLTLDWFLHYAHVTQTQAFTLPWAAYFAFLAYRRRHLGHAAYDSFTALALAILTFPLAGQALASDGQAYGLILIFEALALVFVGMGLHYRLVTLWGVATLVAEVLYQLRDFLYGLPKYVISAALGLALLAVAIVLLQRRKGDQ